MVTIANLFAYIANNSLTIFFDFNTTKKKTAKKKTIFQIIFLLSLLTAYKEKNYKKNYDIVLVLTFPILQNSRSKNIVKSSKISAIKTLRNPAKYPQKERYKIQQNIYKKNIAKSSKISIKKTA